MSSVQSDLPSIGPRIHVPWGTRTAKRRDQVHLWSAVALQQHFARGAMVNCPLPTLEEPPAPLPGGRLSLAQKMGLVPLPPPAPSEEEWSRIEVSVLGRIRRQPMGSNVCYICHDAFYATMEQRQVLLSCQHVFHEQCLRQFERFARQLRGKHDATPLCCPVCRNKHYHKRFFYAGKAMEQRAAVVKLQAFFRRVLARKMYVKMRLESDSEFCAEYACQRLGRLYDTWAIYADLQEKERERLFNAIDLRKQRAAAECMVPEEWDALRRRVENSSRGAPDCPICLCKIQRDLETQVEQPAQTAEEIVARLRRDYEARKAERSALINPPKATLKVATQREGKSVVKRNARRVGESRGRVGGVQAPIRATKGVSDPAVSRGEGRAESPVKCKTPDHAPLEPSNEPRYGALLSCGHCFHDVCLSVFERYTEMMAMHEDKIPLLPTCPLCRAAYAKIAY